MKTSRFNKIKNILTQRQPDLTVLMDNVNKAHNAAAIARTCDASGILDIHAFAASEKIKITQKTSGGVKKWTRIHHHESAQSAINFLKQENFQIITAHLTENSVDYREIDFTKKTALVVGAELSGISCDAVQLSDQCIHIPMHGMTQSLNVSVACALILFEAERQRNNNKMYSKSRLEYKEYKKILFEWAYPDIADFCKKKDIRYPDFDIENGRLLKPFKTSEFI
ncbi:MAG: tRNA (guanosine(18)-2'-O)-methyltransferase TrmH [Thermodesulfobacteriota bacterium]